MTAVAVRLTLVLLSASLLFGCSEAAGRDLDELVVRDSLYVDPETLAPYSGRVFRVFPVGDGGGVQLEATLRDGAWEGEMTVYHSTGRVRQQGSTAGGAKCGGWIEKRAAGSLGERVRPDQGRLGVPGHVRALPAPLIVP